jgi:hypothetical protein
MERMIARWAALLLVLLAVAAPARADDISAAGRSVVRVVVIAFGEDGEVTDFGHGSGFAVAPNRIVTNAHVVAMAQQGRSVTVGVVPSEGQQAYRARIVAIDPARDLALLELNEGSIPAIALYVGPLDDGTPVAALGYPGNVDLATARSAEDYITPLPPTRSVGIFSNPRPINGISLLLHTAQIARGNSGGPLLDQCGRVLGVNTLITHNEDGDSSFAFAVSNRELTAFLRQAGQAFQAIGTPCVSMADQLRADQARREAAARTADEAADARARRAADARARTLAAIEDRRDTRIGIAGLLLALGLLGFQGAGFLYLRDRRKYVAPLAGAAGLCLIGAIVTFVTRPSLGAALSAAPPPAPATPAPDPARFVGRNLCRLVPERSRITVSSADPVQFQWSTTGCANGGTQFVRQGDGWSRILMPDGREAVDAAGFDPATGEYRVTRYLLDAGTMTRLRAIRGDEAKGCAPDDEARARLADRQQQLAAALPQVPNERLVYTCAPERPPPRPAAAGH